VRRHELLQSLHELLEPRSYFEIGVNTGRSLTLSRTRSVGVDPFFAVNRELHCDLHLVRASSDEFFARRHPFAHLDEPVVDLTFIDGMHLSEYALRDVINTERYTRSTSVIVMDDMLPRTVAEAARTYLPRQAWAGDVYKVVPVLRTLRPDLICLEVDTEPTGVAVILLPDPASRVLLEAYGSLVGGLVGPDPQPVPDEVLHRTHAVAPERLLAAPVWKELRELRTVPDAQARPRVRELLEGAGLAQQGSVVRT
jgi:hypothetical protein